MTDLELHWLAGWLEGEGSFCKAPPSSSYNRIGIYGTSTDKDVIEKIGRLLDTSVYEVKRKNVKAHWKQPYTFRFEGQRAADLMKLLMPLMSARRQSQIQAALDSHKPKYVRNTVRHGGSSGKNLASKTEKECSIHSTPAIPFLKV